MAQTAAGYKYNKELNATAPEMDASETRASGDASHFPIADEVWLLCSAQLVQTPTQPSSS